MFERVLVPLDGSALSERSIPLAVELTERLGIPARLLFAIEGWDQAAQVLARADGELDRVAHSRLLTSTDATLAAARDYLEGQGRHFAVRRVPVETRVVEGRAAGTILEEARREPGTMVVMTTHGRGGLSRMVFGSTAQTVLAQANVPVLLIRAG